MTSYTGQKADITGSETGDMDIVQVIPNATDVWAEFVSNAGTYSYWPVVSWVLVETHMDLRVEDRNSKEARSILGMVAYGSLVICAENHPNFEGYVPGNKVPA